MEIQWQTSFSVSYWLLHTSVKSMVIQAPRLSSQISQYFFHIPDFVCPLNCSNHAVEGCKTHPCWWTSLWILCSWCWFLLCRGYFWHEIPWNSSCHRKYAVQCIAVIQGQPAPYPWSSDITQLTFVYKVTTPPHKTTQTFSFTLRVVCVWLTRSQHCTDITYLSDVYKNVTHHLKAWMKMCSWTLRVCSGRV